MVIGVLGGGQLGRMLALAGLPLGHRFVFLDPAEDAVSAEVGRHVRGEYTDPDAIDRFLTGVDVVTFEFENIPPAALDLLAERCKVPLRPGIDALRTGQDRLFEKTLFREVGLEVPEFRVASDRESLRAAVAEIGTPCVVKSRRMGYDGKGQAVLRSPEDASHAWDQIRAAPPGVIVEAFVPFQRELSVLAVRTTTGGFDAYPLVQNRHEGGILRRTIAPAPAVAPALQEQASAHARAVMERLSYVGVLAIEFFDVGGRLLGNEMAPRVHNSGHWTIEASECSQFENHIRAITGMPLGSTRSRPAAMINLIGRPLESAADVLGVPGAHLHWYGKSPRAGRKVGHVTIVGDEAPAKADLLATRHGFDL